jgi:hypothetical protein
MRVDGLCRVFFVFLPVENNKKHNKRIQMAYETHVTMAINCITTCYFEGYQTRPWGHTAA